jgi:hypothetical protein
MIPLTPDIVSTIQASCRPLLDRESQFHQEFHQSLVELMPDVPLMREPAGQRIAQSMASCVLWAVFQEQPDVVAATLQGVGLDAHRLGFPRSGYQSVGHALLRSVRAVHHGDWSGTLSSSWIGYHSWLCEHWLHGADTGLFEDRAQPPAGPQGGSPAGPQAAGSFLTPGDEGREGDPDADEDDEEGDERLSYGAIMVSMALGSSRASRWRGRRKRPEPEEEDD